MRIRPAPLGYFTMSGISGYYAAKFALKSTQAALHALFGTATLTERWIKALENLSQGKFSWLSIAFGENSWKERVKKLSSCGSYLITSCTLGLLSYSCYWLCTRQEKEDLSFLEPCVDDLNLYKEQKKLAWQRHAYWTQSLCELEEEQWKSTLPQVQECYDYVYSWGFRSSYMQSQCENLFNQETFKVQNKDYILRDQVDKANLKLKEQKEKVQSSCLRHLDELDKLVNKKCSALFPFIGLDSSLMCSFLQWSPMRVSEDCLAVCRNYQKQAETIYQELDAPLPATRDFTLNCEEKLKDKKDDFSLEVLVQDQLIEVSQNFLTYIGKQEDTYQGYWRKGLLKQNDYNAYQHARVGTFSEYEHAQLSKQEKDFFRRFFRYRRNLIKDFEEKLKLKRLLEDSSFKNSTDLFEKAHKIYMA